jgi:hypothetical protein
MKKLSKEGYIKALCIITRLAAEIDVYRLKDKALENKYKSMQSLNKLVVAYQKDNFSGWF